MGHCQCGNWSCVGPVAEDTHFFIRSSKKKGLLGPGSHAWRVRNFCGNLHIGMEEKYFKFLF
jgi:hypothetical protein